MDEKRRSAILGLSAIAGALALATLQVGFILASGPQEKGYSPDPGRMEARPPARDTRETRFLPAKSYPRS